MKTCPCCGKTKPLDQFHRNRSTGDGRFSYCKECNIARVKKWQYARAEREGNWDFSQGHPLKAWARVKTHRLIKYGYLQAPTKCSFCDNASDHNHHEDYTKPHIAVPMCTAHHFQYHSDPTLLPCLDAFALKRLKPIPEKLITVPDHLKCYISSVSDCGSTPSQS
jgi:hypothetical protein